MEGNPRARHVGQLPREGPERNPAVDDALQARPDLAERVDRVDVGDDGVMAGAFQALLIKRPARPPADHRRHRHGDGARLRL